jgi:hypothetical protein
MVKILRLAYSPQKHYKHNDIYGAINIMSFPDDLDVDNDGYPNDEVIDQICKADDISHAARWLVETFPKLVESIPYGYVNVEDDADDFGSPMKVVKYSTGGWSGQEAFINAVESSMLGVLYLYSWQRGGHYTFRVPVSHLKVSTLET